MNIEQQNGRYLLFMDILGFSELVAKKGSEDVYRTVTNALDEFDRWERLNGNFRTIYFSDSFIFYQNSKGYGDWAFLDVYAIGGMVLSALLAKGIAARGAISFGEFEVISHHSNNRQVYFGAALIEAHLEEKKENWIGISILPSAWKPFDEATNGNVTAFEREHAWLRKNDILLMNPFIKLPGWYEYDQLGDIEKPYSEWDAPDFPNEIAAFRFIHDESQRFIAANDFSGRVASKYHATVAYLKAVLGDAKYRWACQISGVKTE